MSMYLSNPINQHLVEWSNLFWDLGGRSSVFRFDFGKIKKYINQSLFGSQVNKN